MNGLEAALIGAGAGYHSATREMDRLEDRRTLKKQQEQADQLNLLRMEEARNVAGDRAQARRRKDLYGKAIIGAKDREAALSNLLTAAQDDGDFDTFDKVSTNLASLRAENYSKNMAAAAQRFQVSGDPTELVNTYNPHPDGQKVVKAEAVGDGTFRVQFAGPDAKLTKEQIIDGNALMNAAMSSADPKKAFEIYKVDLTNKGRVRAEEVRAAGNKATAQVRAQGNYDVAGLNAGSRERAAETAAGSRVQAARLGLEGAKVRATATTTAATTRANAAGKTGSGAAAREGRVALATIFRDPINSLSADNQKHQLDAQARMEELVADGVPPLAAAKQAFNETNPKNPRARFLSRVNKDAGDGGPKAAPKGGLSANTRSVLGLDDEEDDDDD